MTHGTKKTVLRLDTAKSEIRVYKEDEILLATVTDKQKGKTKEKLCKDFIQAWDFIDSAVRSTFKDARHKHGEYGWVKLTDKEYRKLCEDFGEPETEDIIDHIDNSAQSTGNKNKWKDWYLVCRNCYRGQWHKKGYVLTDPPKEASYDMDEFKRRADRLPVYIPQKEKEQ